MKTYELIGAAPHQPGDFAVRVPSGAMGKYAGDGETVYLRRSTRLENGDVGLFYARDGLVFRQFCRDSEGIIYLFNLDRSRKEDDLRIPAAGEKPVCYGKVLLSRPVPLPMD